MSSSSNFIRLFRQSPIKPLQEHMQCVVECAQYLLPFFKTVIADDWEKANEHYKQIVNAENRADKEKKQIRLGLPKSLFMAISRQDLLNLLSKQDKLANTSKDIAGLMLGRKMQVPAAISSELTVFVKTAINTTLAAGKVINELDELIETGFGGREIELIEGLISTLDDLEHETDEQQIHIRSLLHPLESELPSVDVIFLYTIIERIGNLADAAQTAGDQIHVIVAR
jgi:predicted phosphate transport protein (TIGR00153 family)